MCLKGMFYYSRSFSRVVRDTFDELPMAYKNMDEIVKHIAPTAEIVDRLIPIYNFKATE